MSSRFYVKQKDIEKKEINACQRGKPVEFETKLQQAATMIEQIVDHYSARTLVVCDSWFGNYGLWKLLQKQNGSIDLLSRLRCNNNIFDLPKVVDTKPRPGRKKTYGNRMGNAKELAELYRERAVDNETILYGKKRQQKVYDKVVMLKTLRCKVRVVWIYRRTRYIALYTTVLRLTVQQIIEYYAARWKIEAGFKELKQDIGSSRSQTRDAFAVNNHLQMCLMATTITWQYAQRITYQPKRRHAVNNRSSFAFSDVRRAISKVALSDQFRLGLPIHKQKPKNSLIKIIMRLVA